MTREIFAEYDIYGGMRSKTEYEASRHLADYVLWVDAWKRGVPYEPKRSMSVGYDPESMIWLDNNGSLDDLRGAVGRLAADLTWVR